MSGPGFNWGANRSLAELDLLREFMRLAEYERGLLDLFVDAVRRRPDSTAFYRHFKPRIQRLAGTTAQHPGLSSCDDYDTVYRTIYSLAYDDPDEGAAT